MRPKRLLGRTCGPTARVHDLRRTPRCVYSRLEVIARVSFKDCVHDVSGHGENGPAPRGHGPRTAQADRSRRGVEIDSLCASRDFLATLIEHAQIVGTNGHVTKFELKPTSVAPIVYPKSDRDLRTNGRTSRLNSGQHKRIRNKFL